MKGIVIAAGLGSRMGPLTQEMPKCMLPVGQGTLLDHTLKSLRAAGCSDIAMVVGWRAEKIVAPGVTVFHNAQYRDTNILHSLMTARDFIHGDLMITYSDIWVEPDIHRRLAKAPGDIVAAVDADWQPYYDGRQNHPLSEAERVHVERDGVGKRFGKHLPNDAAPHAWCGEFLGLWRMSAAGTAAFRGRFDEVNEMWAPDAPFQAAREWRKAYITDMFQELTDTGVDVSTCAIERGWAELDTQEDYERLQRIAQRQRLWTLMGKEECS